MALPGGVSGLFFRICTEIHGCSSLCSTIVFLSGCSRHPPLSDCSSHSAITESVRDSAGFPLHFPFMIGGVALGPCTLGFHVLM